MITPVVIRATGTLTKGLKKNLEAIPGQHLLDSLKRRLCLERHTQYGNYCSLTLEACAVGITAQASRAVPGRNGL
jgi:hypothetical protein